MKKLILSLSLILAAWTCVSGENPKREFRGAWMHTVHQGQYARQTTEQNQAYLRNQLDSLQAAGVNAILWQVRPSADALYQSNFEPWSRFLSGKAGVAPAPYWDPLQFMIEESHKRGMELHAWLNPYRVTTSPKEVLPKNHIYYRHPERFVTYDNKLYFDPGLPENRDFIENVVNDIITRYDVDGIHMDDYFYPYPVAGKEFPDDKSYAKYGNGMKRDDWRRKNVDQLIEGLHKLISGKKPWIRFGVSPFGIWRNKKTDPRGSETNGLQNYDALYADVLLWTENGWVDYMLPQLYWELEHKAASYLVLVDWWNRNANGRHMYIGQDVNKTMKLPDLAPSDEKSQLRHKIELTRKGENIQGNCWWPGYSITRNVGGVADSLANDLQSTIALPPAYPWISEAKPAKVKGVKIKNGVLSWASPAIEGKVTDVNRYVVYRADINDPDKEVENPENIVAVTYETEYIIPGDEEGYYFVTALNRVNNESEPSMVIRNK
ncbi:MAG: family 10 glycosylhydrolase [Muribaculaceae bacterium]|nr:family 10 glycosylhydrolase [Muribaculaceae bacterium]